MRYAASCISLSLLRILSILLYLTYLAKPWHPKPSGKKNNVATFREILNFGVMWQIVCRGKRVTFSTSWRYCEQKRLRISTWIEIVAVSEVNFLETCSVPAVGRIFPILSVIPCKQNGSATLRYQFLASISCPKSDKLCVSAARSLHRFRHNHVFCAWAHVSGEKLIWRWDTKQLCNRLL